MSFTLLLIQFNKIRNFPIYSLLCYNKKKMKSVTNERRTMVFRVCVCVWLCVCVQNVFCLWAKFHFNRCWNSFSASNPNALHHFDDMHILIQLRMAIQTHSIPSNDPIQLHSKLVQLKINSIRWIQFNPINVLLLFCVFTFSLEKRIVHTISASHHAHTR